MNTNTQTSITDTALVQKRAQIERTRKITRFMVLGLLGFLYAIPAFTLFGLINSKLTHTGFFEGLLFKTAEIGIDTQMQLIIKTAQSTVLIVSAIGIVIWLIKILISFIRYNMSLTNLLQAQADALLLSNGDPEKLRTYVEALSTANVQFGEIPSSSYEKLIDLASLAIGKR